SIVDRLLLLCTTTRDLYTLSLHDALPICDARRHLALADVHGERTSRVKPTPARRGAQAWWCSAVLDVRRLRAVGVGRGREQELRVGVSRAVGQAHARG